LEMVGSCHQLRTWLTVSEDISIQSPHVSPFGYYKNNETA
jgi:hypothetical protein